MQSVANKIPTPTPAAKATATPPPPPPPPSPSVPPTSTPKLKTCGRELGLPQGREIALSFLKSYGPATKKEVQQGCQFLSAKYAGRVLGTLETRYLVKAKKPKGAKHFVFRVNDKEGLEKYNEKFPPPFEKKMAKEQKKEIAKEKDSEYSQSARSHLKPGSFEPKDKFDKL
eukprot:TRINITY_DN6164_c0_g4_i5.p1 TRINITY_DN6164_c0_g4~~TRINITY_DN6164_c0_g4_i5.p1  ORF type:complete len:171 (-),score=67.82 TRINITY_DN6164_c0_g4_i5:44-556(-)